MEKIIDKKWIDKALEVLKKYKEARDELQTRMERQEKWYRGKNWDVMEEQSTNDNGVKSKSAWGFNSLANKHADYMDNFPMPSILPREQSDETTASTLTSVVPVVLERNRFENTYSKACWDKIKFGTAVYGAFWNQEKDNGLGDIDIRAIDILNLYWEPGIEDIQESKMLFHINFEDRKSVARRYPEVENYLGGISEYKIDYKNNEKVEDEKKTIVYDCYYKKKETRTAGETEFQVTVLHYVKFVQGAVLYSSENENKPWYEHGKYPYVFDVMFPEKASPAGFGYIDIMMSPQEFVDKLDSVILRAADRSKTRYFASKNLGINIDDFADATKDILEVNGIIDESNLRQIKPPELPGYVENIRQAKIEELKETSSNRDFSQGSTASGVTAASAIAALQEAGSKTSRDMIRNTYDAYSAMVELVIELMREFYDVPRLFRVTEANENSYQQINNQMLSVIEQTTTGEIYTRKPVFDIKISAQKASPYSRIANNELAKELYQMGLFLPENATQALAVLKIMDFDRKDEVEKTVMQNKTLYEQLQAMQQQMVAMAQIIAQETGRTDLLQAVAQPIQPGSVGNVPMETKTADTTNRENVRGATEVKA